jgi:hypothetical protein
VSTSNEVLLVDDILRSRRNKVLVVKAGGSIVLRGNNKGVLFMA